MTHPFQQILNLFVLALEFDQITATNYPIETVRVAAKESLITRMSDLIVSNAVPLVYINNASDNGLKTAFLRAIGETVASTDVPSILPFIENIARNTGTEDWNLKWQIVRAYRGMHNRFPTDATIVKSATNALPYLTSHEDVMLTAGITAMKKELGITP